MDFKGKSGISIEIITQKVKKELKLNRPKIKKNKRNLKNRIKDGKLSVSDWNYICEGLDCVTKILEDKIDRNVTQKAISQADSSKIQKYVIEYRKLVENFLFRIKDSARLQMRLHEEIDPLYEFAQISQAARDGIIMKKEERIDIFNGEKKDVTYDVTMTPEEVMRILRHYEEQSNQIYADKLVNYFGLGLSVSGIVGLIAKNQKDNENSDFKYITVSVVSKIITEVVKKSLREKLKTEEKEEKDRELDNKQWKIEMDLFRNEQISDSETKMIIEEHAKISKEKLKNDNQLGNIDLSLKTISDIVQALIVGAYINTKVKITENGNLDGKSFATALISMKSNDIIIQRINGIYSKARYDAKKYKDFDAKKAEDIIAKSDYANDEILSVNTALDKSGEVLGYVISVTSHEGSQSDITLSVGIRNDGTLNGYSITSISETPGLGMLVQEKAFYSQFENKSESSYTVVKTAPSADNEIEAVTGATISSRAVTNAVNASLVYFQTVLQGGN